MLLQQHSVIFLLLLCWPNPETVFRAFELCGKRQNLSAGRFGTDGKRQDERAKAMYANGDSFFGQYSADKRSGQGLYVFAKGGVHAGQRQQGGMPCQASRPVCLHAASLALVIILCIGIGNVAFLWLNAARSDGS